MMSQNDTEQEWELKFDCQSRLCLVASSSYDFYKKKSWTAGKLLQALDNPALPLVQLPKLMTRDPDNSVYCAEEQLI